MKKWRLGLDLGTNSIGWSVLELDHDNIPIDLIDMGVRIFSDGRDPKTKEPLAVARRTARGIRRNIFRKKQRRRQLFRLLQNQNLFPSKRNEAQKLKSLDPYELRVKALDHILEPNELGRVLFHFGVRRGFKSNRKDIQEEALPSEKTDKNIDVLKMTQSEKIESLLDAIKQNNCRTLGEFLYKLKQQDKGIRFTPDRSVYYPLRSFYKDEFDKIKEVQNKKYVNIDWLALEHAIFYQRPLKPQERGKCQFMLDKERTFKALPSSHTFRILQEVYNLIMYDELNKKIPLSDIQSDCIIKELQKKEKLTFDQIRKLLNVKNRFNLETENRSELKGNATSVKMRKPINFGPLWDTLSSEDQDDIVEILIIANEDFEVLEKIKKFNLSEEQQSSLLKINFQSGTTSVCKEFTQKIIKIMQKDRLQYHQACLILGYEHSDQKVDSYNLLPYYGKILQGSTIGGKPGEFGEDKPEKKYGKIANPTVHVALNQTRVVLNSLIKQYGKPAQISVELTRDLKTSKESKKEIAKKQAENAKRNEILNKNIQEMNLNIQYPGRFERQKFKLWEELGTNIASRCCLYCGKNIGASELFGPNIEIEHILPFSRTLLDAESNLTIAHKSCNAFKAEHSPYEAFASNPKGYNWLEIMARVRNLNNKTKQSRFSQDAMEVFEKESGFITRQLTDNAYLSRVSLRYLRSICDDIWAVNGAMTKLLRDKWDIDSILKKKIEKEEIVRFELKDNMIGQYKKNRFDHRHHALDSIVIGLIDRSLVQRIASLNAKSLKHRLEVPTFPINRIDLIDKTKNLVVSFKPDHGPEGKLSKETYLGKIKKTEEIDTSTIKEEDLPNVRDQTIKQLIETKIIELKDYKKAILSVSKEHPKTKILQEKYVTRMPLSSLKKESNVADIVDLKIRQNLQNFIASNPGQTIDKLVVQFSDQTGIKKVRCVTRMQTPIIIEPNKYNPLAVHRYLNPEEYFTAIIWKLPQEKVGKPAKYQAQYVRLTEINHAKEPIESKPHPAAQKICVLYKEDCIEFSENGIWKKARIAGYAATQNKLDIRPIFSATSSIKDWIITTSVQCLEKGWKEIEGQNYISVNVLFGEKSARKITVSPIGRVFRK